MPAKDPDFPLALPEQAGATSTPVVAKRPEKDVQHLFFAFFSWIFHSA